MKNLTFLIISLIFASPIFAQSGVSSAELKEIKKSYKKNDAYVKAVTNAVSNGKISKLALNRQNVGKIDHEFKYKVSVKGITNQEKSGRCWMFTSLNILRPKVMKKYELSEFEFSTNYLYFWDIFEKSNFFLDLIIESRNLPYDDRKVAKLFSSVIGDGGAWNSFTNLVEKYGLVPKQAMPETKNSENTRMMMKLLKRKLRENAVIIRDDFKDKSEAYIKNAKIKMLGDIYKILAISLGEPPESFYWRYKNKSDKISDTKKYTPMSFMKEVIGEVNFDDYIMLMDVPNHAYNKVYEVEEERNTTAGKNWLFINLPASKIKEFALKSIKDNEAMYFSCDVGKQLNSDEGLLSLNNYDYESLFGVKFGMTKKERILSHESGSTHGMALVAVDTDEKEKITKWKLENSWGKKSGHEGYLTMTDKWFDEYMFRLVVLKKYIDKETLKILEQKPEKIPYWNPMFLNDK